MSPLAQLLSDPSRDSTAEPPIQDSIVDESDWIEFEPLACVSGKLLVIDPAFAGNSEDSLVVESAPGEYRLAARIMRFGSDIRVSRLRAVRTGASSFVPGEKIGDAWADVARIGICDAIEFQRGCDVDSTATDETIEGLMDDESEAGTLAIAGYEQAPLHWVSSGFGDGTFPVIELRSGAERVGFEVEFIAPGTPYPFTAQADYADPSELPPPKPDPVMDAMLAALKQFQRTGDRATDKEQMRALLEKASQPFVDEVVQVAEELHQEFINVRKSAPPMTLQLLPDSESASSESARSTLKEMEAEGFILCGHFKTNFGSRLSLAFLPGTPLYADVLDAKDGAMSSVGFRRKNDTSIFARSFASAPGITAVPWSQHLDLPGSTFAARLAAVKKHIDPDATVARAKDLPSVIESGFAKTQLWRADRGGWTLEEIRLQMGVQEIAEEELILRRQKNADLWLYNWLRIQSDLPINPPDEIASLLIIHDELDSDILSAMWLWATGNAKTRRHEFEEAPARTSFAKVNAQNGHPLRLLKQKISNYPADFYLAPKR